MKPRARVLGIEKATVRVLVADVDTHNAQGLWEADRAAEDAVYGKLPAGWRCVETRRRYIRHDSAIIVLITVEQGKGVNDGESRDDLRRVRGDARLRGENHGTRRDQREGPLHDAPQRASGELPASQARAPEGSA